jgi:class 3 adenylate cyclase
MLELWWWNIELDLRAVLPSIRVPTLVLQRERSVLVHPNAGRFLADNIAGSTFRTLPGADNLFYTEAGDEFVDLIEEFVTGTTPVRETDRGLATVLFTDIVGSTEHLSRLGDRRWTDLLDDHDQMTSRELDRHRGRRVNHTGDGIVAIFDGRAVRCAQAIGAGVRSLGIDVRAGVHTGEIERRGDEVSGIAIHIGQRVSSLAGPGEVLVSSTVKDLVSGSGIQFADRGAHELKGVPDTWRIFAVIGA